jgi:tetratricopeptide (TPR) repeat protein
MQTPRIAVLLAAASLVLVQRVAAQDARQRQAAAEAYDQGTAAYLASDYEKAAEWFETANRLAPAAPALIQAARSLQEAGLAPRAASLALRLATEYPDQAQVTKFAQDMLDRHGGKLLRVDVRCEQCTLDVDGTLQEWPSFFVTPNETHVITASFETGDRNAEVNGAAGDTTVLEFEAPPRKQPVAPGPPPDVTPGRGRINGTPIDSEAKPLTPAFTFVGVGLTAALAVASVVSTVDMNAGVKDYEAAVAAFDRACKPPAPNTTADCDALFAAADDELKKGQKKETRSTVLWVATGAVGVATLAIALLLTDWDGEDDAADARRAGVEFALVPGVRDASLVLKGRF